MNCCVIFLSNNLQTETFVPSIPNNTILLQKMKDTCSTRSKPKHANNSNIIILHAMGQIFLFRLIFVLKTLIYVIKYKTTEIVFGFLQECLTNILMFVLFRLWIIFCNFLDNLQYKEQIYDLLFLLGLWFFIEPCEVIGPFVLLLSLRVFMGPCVFIWPCFCVLLLDHMFSNIVKVPYTCVIFVRNICKYTSE